MHTKPHIVVLIVVFISFKQYLCTKKFTGMYIRCLSMDLRNFIDGGMLEKRNMNENRFDHGMHVLQVHFSTRKNTFFKMFKKRPQTLK